MFKYLDRGGQGEGGGVFPHRGVLTASCRLVRFRTAFAGNLARGMEWDGHRDGACIALNSSILMSIPSFFSEVGETAILLLMPAESQVESGRVYRHRGQSQFLSSLPRAPEGARGIVL